MQAHFNETFENLSSWSVVPAFVTFAIMAAMLALVLINSSELMFSERSAGSSTKLVLVVSVSSIAFVVAAVIFNTEQSKINDAKAEQAAVISKLVVDTVDPIFDRNEIASLKLVSDLSSDENAELKISAQNKQQLVLESTDSESGNRKLYDWARDLYHEKQPSVEVFYQDGKIETLEAGFTSDGEFELSSPK